MLEFVSLPPDTNDSAPLLLYLVCQQHSFLMMMMMMMMMNQSTIQQNNKSLLLRQCLEQLIPNTTKHTLPHHSQSEGVVTYFTMMPHIIPPETPNHPLLKADQALLMCLHEQLSHCSFHQLCQLAERGIIPK